MGPRALLPGDIERALRGAKSQSWGLKRPPAGRGCRPTGLTHFPWDDPAVACVNNMIVTGLWPTFGPRIDLCPNVFTFSRIASDV